MLDSFDFERELKIDQDMLEGGARDKKSTSKKSNKKSISEPEKPSILKFLKIVEKPQGRKPAGTEHLPGDVMAVGS
jgi:hypothetical protein